MNIGIMVQPDRIWRGQDDAPGLTIIARSMVLPYSIGFYFSNNDQLVNISCLPSFYLALFRLGKHLPYYNI